MTKASKLFFLFSVLIMTSCTDDDTIIPRQRGYFRIDLPEKKYEKYIGDCPFTFDYPQYSVVHKDEDKNAEPCWINIDYPRFKARLHLSYKPVNNNINTYLADAWELASKHQIKATGIEELNIKKSTEKVYGLVYNIEGNAASSLQFYLTDSTHHFIRGALYFMAKPNADSIAPVVDFIQKDVTRFIESFQWKTAN